MSQKVPMKRQNETKVLVLSLLITIGLIAIGFRWGINFLSPNKEQPSPSPRQERISLGEKILVTGDTNPYKEAAVKAFASGNYTSAIAQLQTSLQLHRNDPEALIYLNNAQVANQQTLNPNQRVFKIAVSVPISSNLNIAKEMMRGVAQSQEEVNRRGGINGSLVQVEIANDENNAELAKGIAAEFVKDTRIVAVVGHNASNASAAAAPLYEKGKLVMISPTSFANDLPEMGEYIFRSVPSIGFVADTLSHYTTKTARKANIAICFDSQSPDNQSFRNEFISALFSDGGKFINSACDFSAPNFNPDEAISNAISSGADGLLLTPHVDRIEQAMEIARANKGRLTLFGSPTLYTFTTLKSGQKDVNGLVLAVPWHPEAIPGNPFPKNAAKLWGGSVNWRTATAYDATQAIITGLRQSNTREGLQKVLSRPDFSAYGATGTIQFLPSGDRNGAAILVKVQPGKQSDTGYDFVPLRP